MVLASPDVIGYMTLPVLKEVGGTLGCTGMSQSTVRRTTQRLGFESLKGLGSRVRGSACVGCTILRARVSEHCAPCHSSPGLGFL